MAARCISHGPARRSPYLWKVAGVILTWLTGVGYVTLEDPGDYSEERLGLGLYVLLGNTTIVRSKTDVGSGAWQPHTHDPSASGCQVPWILIQDSGESKIYGERIRESPGSWRMPRVLFGQSACGESSHRTAHEEEPKGTHFKNNNFRLSFTESLSHNFILDSSH